LTSISGGTGITVSPNPITTTGTVSADTTFLFTQSDTLSLNLTSRFAAKLNPADTVSLSNRINAKGSGTVTSVASGFGLLGGTITTSGTLRLDTTTIYARLQDSIDVAIGGDTIKILKQEYQPATTNVLTWTVTSKFPIQLKAYILVFRNGQLLNNDQYNLTDTNKITIVITSFKSGSNYTIATVSGIGSVGTGVYPNPVYPDAGIALSTGSAWASSITNNSSNWNMAYSDRLKWDGGSTDLVAATGRTSLGGSTIGQSMFTLTNPSAITFPRFNADNTVTALTAANFRSAIGVGTVTSVTVASTAGNPLSITNTTTTPTIDIQVANTSNNGYLTSTDWNTFNGKQSALGFTPANSTININTTAPLQGGGNLTSDKTLSILSASNSQSGVVSTNAQEFSGNKVFKHRLTADSLLYLNNTTPIPVDILGLNSTGNVNSVGKFTLGSGLSISTGTLLADTNFLVTRYDTTSMLTNYLRTGVAASTYQPLLSGTTNYLPKFTGTSTLGNSVIQESSGNIGIGITPVSSLQLAAEKSIQLRSGSSGYAKLMFSETGTQSENDIEFGGTLQYNGVDDRLELLTRDNLGSANLTNLGISLARTTGNVTIHKPTTMSSTLGVTGAATLSSTLAVTGATTLSNLAGSGTRMVTASSTGVLSTQAIPSGGGGTVTNVSGSGAISVINGTTTPVISVADAAFGTAGIVTATGTQQFSGDKTFEGIVQFNARAVFKDYTYTATRLAGLSSTDRLSTVTLGTGLTLSSGVLSATGGVTSVTASTPLSSSGGTTPNITIADASASASGVVNTTTQSFAGNKTFTGTINVSSTGTFGGRVNTPWLERTYTYTTSSSISVGVNTTWLDINTSVLTTLTLPNAATYPGKEIHIRQTGAGSLQSASSNIIPFSVPPTGSTSTGILTASTHRSVTLVSDGTNWIIMQRSDI